MDILRHELLAAVTHEFTLNDQQLENLHAAAKQISEAIKGAPTKLIPFALVAIDSNIPEDSPALVEAEQAVIEHWQSLRSQYKPRPVGLLRYVILLALQEAAASSSPLASALYLTLLDPIRLLHSQAGLAALTKYMDSLRAAYEKEAKSAMESADVDFQGLKPSKTSITLAQSAKDALASAFSGAVQNGQPVIAGHPPSANWTEAFSGAMADAMKTALDSLGAQAAKALESRLAADENVVRLVRDAAAENIVTERRTNLLWWMQARYSKRLGCRYRKLIPWSAAIAMAEDLWQLAPDPIGPEVEALLEESLYNIFGDTSTEESTLLDALKHLANDPDLGNLGSPTTESGGRQLLCDFVRGIRLIAFKGTESSIKATLGVPGKSRVTPAALGIWYLRGISAHQLTSA